MKVCVIGAGSWGTALAALLADNGHADEVVLWARRPEVADHIDSYHENPAYLVGHALPASLRATSDFDAALEGADAVLMVVPSSYQREFAERLRAAGCTAPVLLCSKGLEASTGDFPVQVFASVMGEGYPLAVLSGPNHAEEIVRGLPSASVAASNDPAVAEGFQRLLSGPNYRVYTGDDVVGVEVCAAYKNVIAIAVGLSYGHGMGDNTAALIMTRGLAEMSRLVEAKGGSPITCLGLAGTGDLIATCTSPHSRNRSFGEAFAHGESLEAYCERRHMVVEGALAAKNLVAHADAFGVEIPIATAVEAILYRGADPARMMDQLIERPLKSEF